MTDAQQTTRRFACLLVGCALIPLTSSRGGEFSDDFNRGLPAGARLSGDALIDPAGGINKSGVLKLTRSKPTQIGSCILPPLDATPVSSFKAEFKTFIGGGNGGHGLSFCVAHDYPDTVFGESGAGSGLIVSFSTAQGVDDLPRGIRVLYGGTMLTNVSYSGLRANRFVDTTVQWNAMSGLSISYNGVTVLDGVSLPGVTELNGDFAFGARTGSVMDWHCVDDLTISTELALPRYVLSFSPSGDHAAPDAAIEFTLRDMEDVDASSVQLTFDGKDERPTLTTNEVGTKLFQFQPSVLLEPGSAHLVHVRFTERHDPAVKKEFSFRFTVSRFISISK